MTEIKASAAEHANRMAKLRRCHGSAEPDCFGASPDSAFRAALAYCNELASDRDRLSAALTDAVDRANNAIDDACVHHGRVLELEAELKQERAKLQAAERVAEAAANFVATNSRQTVPFPLRVELEPLINALVENGFINRDGSRAGGAGGKEGT